MVFSKFSGSNVRRTVGMFVVATTKDVTVSSRTLG